MRRLDVEATKLARPGGSAEVGGLDRDDLRDDVGDGAGGNAGSDLADERMTAAGDERTILAADTEPAARRLAVEEIGLVRELHTWTTRTEPAGRRRAVPDRSR